MACSHPSPPVAPGPPLPAEPDVVVETMAKECDGLIAALAAYGACSNNDDDDRAGIRATIDYAQRSLAAGNKGNPDAKAQRAIAIACRRAATSVHFATVRCQAGPRPRVGD